MGIKILATVSKRADVLAAIATNSSPSYQFGPGKPITGIIALQELRRHQVDLSLANAFCLKYEPIRPYRTPPKWTGELEGELDIQLQESRK
jgi:hypothetical protein